MTIRNDVGYEAGAGVRFGLAYERLQAEDEARRAWLDRMARLPDKDEPQKTPPHACLGCGSTDLRPWANMCPACTQAGWRKGPCPECGGIVNVRDRLRKANGHRHGAGSKSETYWGRCAKCRGRGRPPVERDEEWYKKREAAAARKRWMAANQYRKERAA